MNLTKDQLIAFEDDIAECFNQKLIRAPIHLDNGNEEQLINIFKQYQINENDWICCSWRSHYKCLLKGVPQDKLKEDILAGKSISLCYPEYRIISSAIVGGILPIALGLALSINITNNTERVFAFSGDMTAEHGSFYECAKYAHNYQLPLYMIIEDNNKSVCTPTKDIWKGEELVFEKSCGDRIIYYKYESKWPHSGSSQRVNF